MSKLSRRQLIRAGLIATPAAVGLGAAAALARRYGLVPPDAGGLYGPGETLTYAAQRLLARHSLARECAPSQISKPPFANPVDNLGDQFKRVEAGSFADWRLVVDGMVAHPASLTGLFSAFPTDSRRANCARGANRLIGYEPAPPHSAPDP